MIYFFNKFDFNYSDMDKIADSNLFIYKSKNKHILKHTQRVGISNLSKLDTSKILSDNIIILDADDLIYDISIEGKYKIYKLSNHFIDLLKFCRLNNKYILIPISGKFIDIDNNEIISEKKEIIPSKMSVYSNTYGHKTYSKILNCYVINNFQLKSLIRKISLNSILTI